jgi:hypothetical protein
MNYGAAGDVDKPRLQTTGLQLSADDGEGVPPDADDHHHGQGRQQQQTTATNDND